MTILPRLAPFHFLLVKTNGSVLVSALLSPVNAIVAHTLRDLSQIALFVIPMVTLAGWVIDQPMDLNFRAFDTVLLVLTILIVNMTLGDGKSNWLEV